MEAYLRKQEEVRARAAQSGRQSQEDEIAQRQAFLYQQALARAAAARQREEQEASEAFLYQQAKVRAQAREAKVAAAAEADTVGETSDERQTAASAADSEFGTEWEEVVEAFNKL